MFNPIDLLKFVGAIFDDQCVSDNDVQYQTLF